MSPTGNLYETERSNDRVAFLHLHRAQKRRAQAAAQANARRRRMIAALLLAAGIFTGYTLHREQQLERVHHLP